MKNKSRFEKLKVEDQFEVLDFVEKATTFALEVLMEVGMAELERRECAGE